MSTMGPPTRRQEGERGARKSGWRAKLLFTETKPPRPKPLLANALRRAPRCSRMGRRARL